MNKKMKLNLVCGVDLLDLYLETLMMDGKEKDLKLSVRKEIFLRLRVYDQQVSKNIDILYEKCGENVSNKLAEIMGGEL